MYGAVPTGLQADPAYARPDPDPTIEDRPDLT